MSIITPNDFKGTQNIAGLSNLGTQQSVQSFIDEFEPEFLKKLLGQSLYIDFKAGLEEDPIDAKWTSLRDETDLKQMIICYVYYQYMEYQTTLTTQISEVKPNAENSTPVSNWDKMVKAWNKMVKMTRLFDLSNETYPDYNRPFWGHYGYWWYGCPINEIYYFKNSLNV